MPRHFVLQGIEKSQQKYKTTFINNLYRKLKRNKKVNTISREWRWEMRKGVFTHTAWSYVLFCWKRCVRRDLKKVTQRVKQKRCYIKTLHVSEPENLNSKSFVDKLCWEIKFFMIYFKSPNQFIWISRAALCSKPNNLN